MHYMQFERSGPPQSRHGLFIGCGARQGHRPDERSTALNPEFATGGRGAEPSPAVLALSNYPG